MTDELTPKQELEYHLSRIRLYADTHGISGEDVAAIFEAGIGAAARLRPEIVAKA